MRLQYNRNRYYDPQAGRFTQEDPIGLAGGLNLYGFANGDPVNFRDPFGLTPCGPLTPLCARAAVWLLGRLIPTATIVGASASSGLIVSAVGGGRLSAAALRQAGAPAERAAEGLFIAEGGTILGRQVSAQTSAGRRVIDLLVQKADGSMVAAEVKSGGAVRTATQTLKDLLMSTEGATLVGKNAPVELRGTTVIIPTEVIRP